MPQFAAIFFSQAAIKTTPVGALLFFLLMMNIMVFGQDQTSKSRVRKVPVYIVYGASTQMPDKIRPWSTSFRTEEDAVARIKELKDDYYGSNGLMRSSTDKPIDLKVRKEEGVELEEENSIVPQENDPKQNSGFKPDLVIDENNAFAGKGGLGQFGDSKIQVVFNKDLSAVFVDPATGKVLAKGKWQSAGWKIQIETAVFSYEGSLVGKQLSGTRKFKDKPARPAERWTLKLVAEEELSKNKAEEFSPVGAWNRIEIRDGKEVQFITPKEYRADHTLTYIEDVGTVRWEVNGSELIERYSDGSTHRLEIIGPNRLRSKTSLTDGRPTEFVRRVTR